MNCTPDNNPTRPSFPSLYNPLRERYRTCEQTDPTVTHLEHAGDIFRFTLYWTLILYLPLFSLPALWGLFVHFIPHRISRRKQNERNAAALSAATAVSDARAAGRGKGGAGGSGTTGDRFLYSPLAMDRPSNANALSPRSSEPFLLDSPRATAVDRAGRKGTGTEMQQSTYKRPTFGSLSSWTPSRTLQTLRRRQTDDDSYVMERTRSPRSPRSPASPASPASPISPASVMPNHSLPRVPTMPLMISTKRTPRQSSLRNRSGGVTCLILVIPLAFVIIGAIVGLIGSLVIGYLLVALKDAAGVRISTWLPLAWALIQVHTVLLGMFTNMLSFI